MSDGVNRLEPWNVTMLGPSRVGKTSLLTALRAAGNDVFAGTPVSVEPEDEITRRAFNDNDRLMQSELRQGQFKPDLPGDVEAHSYGLVIDSGVDSHALTLRFNDYPGGWLSNDKSDRVKALLADSPTVIIPIDATLVMEAGDRSMRDLLLSLRLEEVLEKVREWAKERTHNGDSTRLMLVPVKCESYFNDNGGRSDKSDVLFMKVQGLYEEIVKQYAKEAGEGAQLLYAPVDTIGPIEYVRSEWKFDDEGIPRLETQYRVRRDANGRPLRRTVFGAEPVLAQLVSDVLMTQEAALREAEKSKSEENRRRRSNWFKRIIDDWSGRHEQRREDLDRLKGHLERLASSSGALPADHSGRVRQWL